MKFLVRYGHFLYKVVNNEFDGLAILEQAFQIYQVRLSKKAPQLSQSEQTLYGENSACAVVIVSASSDEIGLVVHANEEIENVLGY